MPDVMPKIESLNITSPDKIILPCREQVVVAYVKDIVRCEAKGNYTILFMHNQKPQLVTKTLKEFDNTFKGIRFIRTHKSHLVNLDYIDRYLPQQGKIVMKDGGKADVSRRKKELLRIHLLTHQI